MARDFLATVATIPILLTSVQFSHSLGQGETCHHIARLAPPHPVFFNQRTMPRGILGSVPHDVVTQLEACRRCGKNSRSQRDQLPPFIRGTSNSQPHQPWCSFDLVPERVVGR
jgi:hypothetical protein